MNNGTPLQPFPYFNAFTWATPVIPDIYMNVYSPEEQYMKLCMEYGKLVAYTNAMADTVNEQYESIKDIESNISDIVVDAIKNDPELHEEVMQKIDDYLASLTVSKKYGDLKKYGFVCNKGGA